MKEEYNAHIDRVSKNRIVKIEWNKSPEGRRNLERATRRWSDNLVPG